MRNLFLLVFGMILSANFSFVASSKEDHKFVQLDVAPSSLDADSAYILVRTNIGKSGIVSLNHVLVRMLTDDEIVSYQASKKAAYDAALPSLIKKAKGGRIETIDEFVFSYHGEKNAFLVKSSKFLEDGEMRTLLLQVPPGSYVLYGGTFDSDLVTCNCLGTVSFVARAGVITNVGSFFIDKVHRQSPLPQLESDLGRSMLQDGIILGQAVVPADKLSPIPMSLQKFPMEFAEFSVVQPYHEPGAITINRLAPIEGILGYERGRPVDLRTRASHPH